jgi:hypothetical protein
MASLIYNSAKRDLQNGAIDLNTDDIKVMLVSGYTPNQDTHTKRSDVTGEITGTGYTAGGKSLTTKTMTQDNTNNRGTFDADDLVWATSTLSATGAVFYKSRGGLASADELLYFMDFGATLSSTGGDFKVTMPAAGIIQFNSSSFMYNSAKKEIADGTIDLDTDDIYCMLTLGYTPDIDAHTKRSNVTNEITGTGYSTGGVQLTGKSVSADNTDNEGVFDADDITITSSTLSADGCVLYKRRGGASSADELITYIPFGSTISSTSSNFKITWGAEGILNLND